MSTNDPWERRERERERWRSKSARSAGTPSVLIPRFSSRVLWICSLVAIHLIGDIPAVSQTLRTTTLCLGFVGWVTFLGFNWPTASRNRTVSVAVLAALLAPGRAAFRAAISAAVHASNNNNCYGLKSCIPTNRLASACKF
jgi:hypothetical protein